MLPLAIAQACTTSPYMDLTKKTSGLCLPLYADSHEYGAAALQCATRRRAGTENHALSVLRLQVKGKARHFYKLGSLSDNYRREQAIH